MGGLLDGSLVNQASGGESKVFYQKMKADYYRYKAEYKSGGDKEKASESARQAYQDAHNVAEKDLAVTHPIRLGLALNYSVFQYEVLGNPDQAAAPRQLDLVDFGRGGRRAVSLQGVHDAASI